MLKNTAIRYTTVATLWGLLFFSITLYQFPSAQRFTIFFINKALAQTAVILLGLSFLLGPLCKILPFLARHINYRRYFGLVGFGTALLHIVTSLLQINTRFPLDWYFKNLWAIIPVILAILIFLTLALTSTKKVIKNLGVEKWKFIQRTGYFALFLSLIHIYLVANPRWQQWFEGKVNMPTSFLIFIFGIMVILARILALIVDKVSARAKIVRFIEKT